MEESELSDQSEGSRTANTIVSQRRLKVRESGILERRDRTRAVRVEASAVVALGGSTSKERERM